MWRPWKRVDVLRAWGIKTATIQEYRAVCRWSEMTRAVMDGASWAEMYIEGSWRSHWGTNLIGDGLKTFKNRLFRVKLGTVQLWLDSCMGWLWLVSKVKCSPNEGAMHRISSLWSLLFACFGRYSQWRDDKNLAGNMLNPGTHIQILCFNTARFWWHWGWFIGFSILLGLITHNQQKTRGRGPADPDLRGFSRQTKAAALEKVLWWVVAYGILISTYSHAYNIHTYYIHII